MNSNSHFIKILSNYFGKLWNLLSVFLLVPFYIKYLGVENYGVIGFYTVFLGIISFADAGLSSALIKEFATDTFESHKYHLLRKIEIIYFSIVTIICMITILFSNKIAQQWLNTSAVNHDTLQNYVILIAIGACVQLLSSIYFGALFGLGYQVKANTYQIYWTTSKSVFIIVLFLIVSSSIYTFLIWQIICNIIYVLCLRFRVISFFKRKSHQLIIIPLSEPIPKRILTYIAGMAIIAIISAINIQADKLVISYYFALKVFGYYSVASILSQVPVLIIAPMAAFVFPLLVKFVDHKENFYNVFETFSNLIYLIIFTILFLVLCYPVEIFTSWSRQVMDSDMRDELEVLIRTLSFGSVFLAMQFPFYYILLAKSKTKYTVYQGILQVVLGVPLLIYFAKFYGIKYIGIPWFINNLIALIFLMKICLDNYINMTLVEFFKKFIIAQLLSSGMIVWIGYWIYQSGLISFIPIFILSGLLGIILSLMLSNLVNNRALLDYKHLYNFPKG